jgi:hypothetical protein
VKEQGQKKNIKGANKPYESPKLVVHGSLTKLTGGSKAQNADGANNKKTVN